MCNAFISFRGNHSIGGAIATMVFNTLKNYKLDVYFSSSPERTYGGNYRNEENVALAKSKVFIAILTDTYIDNLHEGDEVLYELRVALENPDMTIIPIAEQNFAWNENRIQLLRQFIGDNPSVDNFIKTDYIKYIGVREYALFTERILIETLGLKEKTDSVGNVFDFRDIFLSKQNENMKASNNASFFKRELTSFANQFYVAPQTIVDGADESFNLTDIIQKNASNRNGYGIIVTGDSGCGKSTFLHRMYSDCLNNLSSDSYIPVFFNVNNDEITSFTRESIINKIIDVLNINSNQNVVDSFLNKFRFIFFIDGLDEATNFNEFENVSKIINSRSSEDFYVFSCRKNKYQYLYNLKIDFHIELQPWSTEERENFCRDVLKQKKIHPLFIKNAVALVSECKILSNAVFLSLFLLYICNSSDDFTMLSHLNEYKIINLLIKNIIKRECDKKDIKISPQVASDILEFVACLHLKSRQDDFEISYDQLVCDTKSAFSDIDGAVVQFLITLFIDENIITENYRFAHETFEEFFIAKNFTDELFKDVEDYPELLKYGFNAETNNFITEIFKERGRESACKLLQNIYGKLPEDSYGMKLQLLNHLHRTQKYDEIKSFAKKLLEATNDKTDEILLLHTLQVVGDEEDENTYYEKMKYDRQFALLNSGFALAYYYSQGKKIQLPYYDDGFLPWFPVFLAYKKHLLNKNRTPHYQRVIRINLLTANNFIGIREFVEPEIKEFFESQRECFALDSSPSGQKIYVEYLNLMKTIEAFSDN